MNGVIVACKECGAKNRVPEKKQHLRPRCGKCGETVSIGTAAVPVSLGDNDFQQFLQAVNLPVMVDFFAPSCGPCQSLSPFIRELAGRYLGRVVIATLDTSRHPGSSAHYKIRGVPSLLFFKNGVEVDQIVGAPPEADLIARLDNLLGG
jgi:thioredoxin